MTTTPKKPTPKKKAKPSKAPMRRGAKRGPPSDAELLSIASLSKNWRDDAELTLLTMQAELRRRVASLDNFELIGGIRAIGDVLTTNQALIDPKTEDPTEP